MRYFRRHSFSVNILVIALIIFCPALLEAKSWQLAVQVEKNYESVIGLAKVEPGQKATLRLLPSEEANKFPHFSPDGRSLFFTTYMSVNDTQMFQIRKLNLETQEITRISDGTAHDQYPVCSPDGKQLAFVSNPLKPKTKAEAKYRIWVMDIDGQNRRILDPQAPVAQGYPSWSPDGTKIVYLYSSAEERFLWFLPRSTLKVFDLEKKSSLEITPPYVFATYPTWSPDGQLIAFVRMTPITGSQNIWVVRPDGSDRQRITSGGKDTQPCWSPDNAKLAFSRKEGDNRVIFQADVKTLEAEKILEAKWSLEYPSLQR
jgi:Tol biopolymer transport system component